MENIENVKELCRQCQEEKNSLYEEVEKRGLEPKEAFDFIMEYKRRDELCKEINLCNEKIKDLSAIVPPELKEVMELNALNEKYNDLIRIEFRLKIREIMDKRII